MARKGGWRRIGSRGRFRYVDARGDAITDEEQLERIRALVIPPAWEEVWISPSSTAKLQATGLDAAGRREAHGPRRARSPARIGDRHAPDQPRLVPRRLRALCARVAHLRHHDAAQ